MEAKKELSHPEIRQRLKKKGIPVARTIFGAKMRCRMAYWKDGVPHWAFAEKYGFVILNLVTSQGVNTARKKNQIRRLRVRDMDRICVFRYPRKGWMVKKLKRSEKSTKTRRNGNG